MSTESEKPPSVRPVANRIRVGVFIEWVADGYSDPILDEIVLAANERDIDIVCFVDGLTNEDVPLQTRHRPFAYATRENIDAALVVSMGNALEADKIAGYFERLEPMPIVSVAVHWSRYPKVVVDNESGVRAGVRHLIVAHGKRHIACVRGPSVSAEANERFNAYRETLQEHHVEFNPELVATGYYYKPHGADAVRTWLDEKKLPVDAIVTANDAMAQGALEELQRRGIRVPEDVALLGFDDIDAARFWRPPLSTIRQPTREHARKAFDLVMGMLHGKRVPSVTSVHSQFVLRRSCGCIASAGRSMSSFPPQLTDEATASVQTWAQRAVGALMAFANIYAPSDEEVKSTEDSLVRALTGDRAPFLRWFEELLDQCIQRHIDTLGIFSTLRDIRRATRQFLGSQDFENAESVLSDADSVVAEVAERSQAIHRYRHEELFTELVRTNEALVMAVDLPSLQRILTENLQRFAIRSCYLCLYDVEEGRVPAEYARLVMACNVESQIDLPNEGLKFRATDILPLHLMSTSRHTTWLVCPLLRRQPEYKGYFVIERGTPEGFVYDGLLDQIGSAYQRIELLNRVVTEARLRERAERERLEKEMQIATTIQTSMLPRNMLVDGLVISAVMHPATEVGGDYYDVIPTEGGCWIGIGDVAGHGLPTGLVMMMLQSVVGGLVRNRPNESPQELLPAVNSLLYDNIRRRLNQDEHITLTLIRYEKSGKLTFSGAHEDILICRAEDGRIECIHTPGVWTAALRDVRHLTQESSCTLHEGDILLLYTDGITEARNVDHEMFGTDRLADALSRHRDKPVDALRDAIMADVRAYMQLQDDDMTLFVAKQSRDSVRTTAHPA